MSRHDVTSALCGSGGGGGEILIGIHRHIAQLHDDIVQSRKNTGEDNDIVSRNVQKRLYESENIVTED